MTQADLEFDELTVHAWCDLEPYKGVRANDNIR